MGIPGITRISVARTVKRRILGGPTSHSVILIGVVGCRVSPSVNVLGSFFPAWLISIVVGVILTVVVRQALVALDVAADLRPAALVYPCLVGLLTFATWLVVFGG